MKVVLDTNVLISGILNPNGAPGQILNLFFNKKIKLLIDTRIYREYEEVLGRPKFRFNKDLLQSLLEFIRIESEFILASPNSLAFTDEDDKMFYEVALTGAASNLITGNRKHFPDDKFIVGPTEFIQIYLEALQS